MLEKSAFTIAVGLRIALMSDTCTSSRQAMFHHGSTEGSLMCKAKVRPQFIFIGGSRGTR